MITLASALFTSRTLLWPLIVADVLAFCGLIGFVGAEAFDNAFGSECLFPVILAVILVPTYLLWQVLGRRVHRHLLRRRPRNRSGR